MVLLRSFRTARLAVAVALALLVPACGDGDCDPAPTADLTIEPAGPVLVQKGETVQFSAGGVPVQWSVVGGDMNGTIGPDGVFSHPEQLPPGSRVTVRAEAPDGRVATATVDLHTAEAITFAAAQQVSTTAILPIIIEASLEIAGVGNQLAVREDGDGLHVAALWTALDNGEAVVRYAQEVDLGGFSAEQTLASNNSYALSADVSPARDPGLLVAGPENALLRVFFFRSDDQGATFGPPIAIDDFIGPQTQLAGALRYASRDVVHAVFIRNDEATPDASGSVAYVSSSDGGATWGAGVAVGDDSTPQAYPQLAVDSTGELIVVCYQSPATGATAVYAAVSTDGGATFGAPVAVGGSGAAFCQVAVGPDGQVYVSYQAQGNAVLAVSSDGGASFTTQTVVNSQPTQLGSAPGPLPHLSVDRLGRVDLVWSKASTTTGAADTLLFARSTDGGQTFSPETTIATTGGSLLYALGLRHDRGGRVHVAFASDAAAPNTAYQVLYTRGE